MRRRFSFLVALWSALASATALAFDTPQEAQAWYDREVDARGAVHWSTLTELDVEAETIAPLQTVFHVRFSEQIKALDQQTVTLIGFIYPLRAGRDQSHFLLSALPPGCPFCLPGGPTTMIDVQCDEPVRYTQEPVIVEGRFELLENDDSGLYYRLTDARPAD